MVWVNHTFYCSVRYLLLFEMGLTRFNQTLKVLCLKRWIDNHLIIYISLSNYSISCYIFLVALTTYCKLGYTYTSRL